MERKQIAGFPTNMLRNLTQVELWLRLRKMQVN